MHLDRQLRQCLASLKSVFCHTSGITLEQLQEDAEGHQAARISQRVINMAVT